MKLIEALDYTARLGSIIGRPDITAQEVEDTLEICISFRLIEIVTHSLSNAAGEHVISKRKLALTEQGREMLHLLRVERELQASKDQVD